MRVGKRSCDREGFVEKMNIYIKFYLFNLKILTGQPAPVWRHLLQAVDVILLDTRITCVRKQSRKQWV